MGFNIGNLVKQIPLIGPMLDDSAQQGMDQLQKNQDLYNNIQTPNLQWSQYTPEMMQAQTVQEDPTILNDQMAALSQMSGLAQNGLSDVDQAAYAQARNQAGQIEHAGEQAALANAEGRGLSGSGMEFAMREMANQNAANSAQTADLNQAAQAAQMRAMYNQAYGQQLANVRNQNYNTAANNTNILNQFNAANTQARNQAQQYNQQGAMNTQQQNFNNQITKAGGQAQGNTGMAQGYAAQNAANTSAQNQWLQAYTGIGQAAIGAAGQVAGAKAKAGGGGP